MIGRLTPGGGGIENLELEDYTCHYSQANKTGTESKCELVDHRTKDRGFGLLSCYVRFLKCAQHKMVSKLKPKIKSKSR